MDKVAGVGGGSGMVSPVSKLSIGTIPLGLLLSGCITLPLEDDVGTDASLQDAAPPIVDGVRPPPPRRDGGPTGRDARPVPPPVGCGDGRCVDGESCEQCPEDCGLCPDTCGDELCQVAESCRTCPQDCGRCDPCGNGVCEADESCDACPQDCGRCETCGNEACDADEDCSSCPIDCGLCQRCGDGECGADEDCANCPDDCGGCVVCGDGFCRAEDGEDCLVCAADCDACPSCGDGACNEGTETCFNCPDDCGECEGCGDSRCTGVEDCASCQQDCGVCSVCGNNVCEEDEFESCVNCPADCGLCEAVTCREIVNCVFGCFNLRQRPPQISLACVGDCTARGCADVQFFVDQAVNCAVQNAFGGGIGGIDQIFQVCAAELEACYAVSCPPAPPP